MAETLAQIGLGSTLGIVPSGGGEAVAVAEITRVTPPGWTRNTVDATHLKSPDGTSEFIAGLKTASDCTFEVNWVPAEDDPLLAAFDAGKGSFVLTFPAALATKMEFSGVVTAFQPGEISPEGKLSASVTIKPSGKPTLSAVAP